MINASKTCNKVNMSWNATLIIKSIINRFNTDKGQEFKEFIE